MRVATLLRTRADEEAEQRSRFLTYLNYLEALSLYLAPEDWSPSQELLNIRSTKKFERLKRNPDADRAAVSRYLRNSWATELQLRAPSANPELLSVANHWATVQLYYAVYLSLRAMFISAGRQVGGTHRAALRTIASEIQSRPHLFPLPWRVCCTGESRSEECHYPQLPAGAASTEVSSLQAATLENFWSYYQMLLRTTRERQISSLAKEWKQKQKRKRLDKGGRKRIDSGLPPTSVFDFLYRLRIRSNYSDADSFLLAIEDNDSATRFNLALRRVCWSTCLVLELQTSTYLGRPAFGQLVNSYSNHVGPLAAEPVIRRWHTLQGSWDTA